MYIKVGISNVILKLALVSAFIGCFFISGTYKVLAAEVTVPAAVYPTAAYLTTENSHSIGIVLPEKLTVGNAAYDLASVTGYRVYVYKDSTELFNSGIAYKDAGSGIFDLENLVRAISLQLTNVSENLRFKVTYIGKNAAGEYADAKDMEGNTIEWMSDILSVYRVSIGGDNINPAYTYGFSGQNVVLMPSIAGNYSFKQWSDGNMQNPRIEQISTNAAENVYQAVVETPEIVMHEDGEGYDVIPQTGEGNSTFWLIFMSVFGVLGTGYVLFSMVLVPMNSMGNGRR